MLCPRCGKDIFGYCGKPAGQGGPCPASWEGCRFYLTFSQVIKPVEKKGLTEQQKADIFNLNFKTEVKKEESK